MCNNDLFLREQAFRCEFYKEIPQAVFLTSDGIGDSLNTLQIREFLYTLLSKLEEQREDDLVYIRSAFYRNKHNLSQKIIFGHTEFDEPLVQEDKICIDLGCGKYKNAKLCALILDNGRENFVYSD